MALSTGSHSESEDQAIYRENGKQDVINIIVFLDSSAIIRAALIETCTEIQTIVVY